ncbi:MAG: hypothetical protein ACRD22_19075, partial [Terriglobia bacterium]
YEMAGGNSAGFAIPGAAAQAFVVNRSQFALTVPYKDWLAKHYSDVDDQNTAAMASAQYISTIDLDFTPTDWQTTSTGILWIMDPDRNRLMGYNVNTFTSVKSVTLEERPLGFKLESGSNLAVVATTSFGLADLKANRHLPTKFLTVNLSTGKVVGQAQLSSVCLDFAPLDNNEVMFFAPGSLGLCNSKTGVSGPALIFNWTSSGQPQMRLMGNSLFLFQYRGQDHTLTVATESLLQVRQAIHRYAEFVDETKLLSKTERFMMSGTGTHGESYQESNPTWTAVSTRVAELRKEIQATRLFTNHFSIPLPDKIPRFAAASMDLLFGASGVPFFGNVVLTGPDKIAYKTLLPSAIEQMQKDNPSSDPGPSPLLDELCTVSPDGRYGASGTAIYDLIDQKILCYLPVRTTKSIFSPDSRSLFLVEPSKKKLIKFNWRDSVAAQKLSTPPATGKDPMPPTAPAPQP